MPYKLQLPASGYISIPTWSAAVGQDFLIEVIFDTPPTIDTDGILGTPDFDNLFATLSINNGAVLTLLGGVLINGDGNAPANQNIFEPSNKYSYKVERVSNQVRTTITNLTTSTVKQDISGVAFTGSIYFTRIGDTQGLTLGGGSFYTIELTRSGDNRYYDANASGGTGTVLPDTINSANNGAQVGSGWSAANWVFYSSGASNTITVSATLPKITGSLTLNEINPSYVISVSGQLPKITGAVTLNEINPAFTVAVSGQLPKITGSIALNQFANNRQVTVNGILPKLTGAVTLNRIQPNNQAAVSGQLPRITASITLRVPDSYPDANPSDYTVSAYLSTNSTYTAKLSESSTINAIISTETTYAARLN